MNLLKTVVAMIVVMVFYQPDSLQGPWKCETLRREGVGRVQCQGHEVTPCQTSFGFLGFVRRHVWLLECPGRVSQRSLSSIHSKVAINRGARCLGRGSDRQGACVQITSLAGNERTLSPLSVCDDWLSLTLEIDGLRTGRPTPNASKNAVYYRVNKVLPEEK